MQQESGPASEDGASPNPAHRNGNSRPVVTSSTSKGPDTAVGNPDEITVTVEYETAENILQAQVEFNITPSGEAQLSDVNGEGSRAEQYIPIAYAAQQVSKNPVVSRVPGVPSIEVVYSQLAEGGSRSNKTGGKRESQQPNQTPTSTEPTQRSPDQQQTQGKSANSSQNTPQTASKRGRQNTGGEESQPNGRATEADEDFSQSPDEGSGSSDIGEDYNGDSSTTTVQAQTQSNDQTSSDSPAGGEPNNISRSDDIKVDQNTGDQQASQDSTDEDNQQKSSDVEHPSEVKDNSQTESDKAGRNHSIEEELEEENDSSDSSDGEKEGQASDVDAETQQTGSDTQSGENDLEDVVSTEVNESDTTRTTRVDDAPTMEDESANRIDPTLGEGWAEVEESDDLGYITAFSHDRGDSLSIWPTEAVVDEGESIDPEEKPYMLHYEYPDDVDKPNEQDFFPSTTSCNGVIEDLMQTRPQHGETENEGDIGFSAA